MKNKFNKIIVLIFSFALLINTSCENFVNGVSEFDPTQPRSADIGLIVNAAEVSIIGFAEGDLARVAGIFTDQFTGVDRQYVSLNSYISTALDYDNQWGNIYAGGLKSLRIAREKAEAINNKRVTGMTKILEGYLMGMTAALWGDVPYSEAVNIEEFPNPTYDTQEEVYTAVLALLEDAIEDINTAPEGVDFDGDFFGGDDAVWIERAYTLIAKYNLHLGNYAEAAAAAQLGISTPDHDIVAEHGMSYLQDFNMYYSFLTYDRPGYMSADFALAPNLLYPGSDDYRGNAKTDETGRFYWFYYDDALNTGVEQFDINVLTDEDGWGNGVEYDGFFAANGSFPILTYNENQLILAEALLRSGDPNGALDELNEWRAVLNTGYRIPVGWVGEGLHYDPYVLTDFAPGGIENADGIPQNDALYREIIEEKYVSLVGQLEVFNDMRRSGFGSFSGMQNWEVVGVTPNTGSTIPQRFLIPQVERNANPGAPTDLPGLFDKTAIFQ